MAASAFLNLPVSKHFYLLSALIIHLKWGEGRGFLQLRFHLRGKNPGDGDDAITKAEQVTTHPAYSSYGSGGVGGELGSDLIRGRDGSRR